VQERDTCSVRGPSRAGALRQKTIAGPVGVHDPEARVPPIVHLVDVSAGVHDLAAIGRDLRIAHLLVVEILLDREDGVALALLCRRWNREQRKRTEDDEGAYARTHRSP